MGLIVLIRISQSILKVVNGTFHHRGNNNDNDMLTMMVVMMGAAVANAHFALTMW